MPPHDGRRLHDLDGVAPAWPASREQHPEQSIGAAQAGPSRCGLLKDGELVPQGQNFSLELNPRAEAGPKGGEDRNRDGAHGRTRYQVRRGQFQKVARTEYPVGTGFDVVFEADGTRIVRTPIQAPEANGIAERFVRTARSEGLDWLLILNARHLARVRTVFTEHYNGWRPHRSLDLAPPNRRTSTPTWTEPEPMTLKRRDRLGGLLHEYERAA